MWDRSATVICEPHLSEDPRLEDQIHDPVHLAAVMGTRLKPSESQRKKENMLESRVVARSAVQTKRGTKQTCKNESCGNPYYDLMRAPPTCPYCGTFSDTPSVIRVDFETIGKQRLPRYNKRVEPPRPPAQISKIEVDEAETVDEHTEKEPALPSAAEDFLIEIEDDDEVQAPVEPESEMT